MQLTAMHMMPTCWMLAPSVSYSLAVPGPTARAVMAPQTATLRSKRLRFQASQFSARRESHATIQNLLSGYLTQVYVASSWPLRRSIRRDPVHPLHHLLQAVEARAVQKLVLGDREEGFAAIGGGFAQGSSRTVVRGPQEAP